MRHYIKITLLLTCILLLPLMPTTAMATSSPMSTDEAMAKYNQAEDWFALGYYEEAIALYDEIGEQLDVASRRAYAVECQEIRDLYYDWSYNDIPAYAMMYFPDAIYNGLVLERYTGYGMEEVIVPYGTCNLQSGTFRDNNEDILSVQLPETLRVIPADCFSGCSNLKTINIPESVEYLALNGTGIVELIIPATVKTIPAGAFQDCTRLKTVVFEGEPAYDSGYSMIPNGPFERCTSLVEITLPASFTHIPRSMFSGCTALQKVVISEGTTSIGMRAFADCTALETVVIPDSVQEIESSAFEGCTSLEKIQWPQATAVMSSDTFRGCTALRDVQLSDGITEIEKGAFAECTALKILTLPKSIKSVNRDAFGYYFDDSIKQELALVVKQGTYGQRYAEECGMNYAFAEDTVNLQILGKTFMLGKYQNQALEWIVVAQCGDHYLALARQTVGKRCFNETEADITWATSTLKEWMDTVFIPAAFSEEDQACFKKIGLLPASYYTSFVMDQPVEDCYLYYDLFPSNGKGIYSDADSYWLDELYYSNTVRVASGYLSSRLMTKEFYVRPAIWLRRDSSLISP